MYKVHAYMSGHIHTLYTLHTHTNTHKVDAYMSGHDHTQQHIENGGVHYYVSGQGALRGSVKVKKKPEKNGGVHYYVSGQGLSSPSPPKILKSRLLSAFI